MSEGRSEFDRMLEAALAVDEPPHLVAARIGQALERRREQRQIWWLFAPGRLALIGSLAVAAGAAIGLFLPLLNQLDPDTLMAVAFSGSIT